VKKNLHDRKAKLTIELLINTISYHKI